MWSAIQWLVVRVAAIRWLFKLGWLGALIPIVMLLKAIGLPVLIVLAIVAIPALFLLLLFGLPIFLVLLFGGMLIGFLGFVLTIGVAAIKFAIFVVLPIWLIWKISSTLFRWAFKRRDDNGQRPTFRPRLIRPPVRRVTVRTRSIRSNSR